ncbi:MAG: MotA/TolQ/ExbB proton channel family protein [Pseudomonadota bacterium]|nr:MotA/TolQ/ExbB proton channel family protein [Pseudomonadota bacterium]
MKFYDFVQENKFLLCFSSGLLSTLVFSTTYFWVLSIVVGVCALLFTKSFTTFVGVTLGLLVGACHFLNFVEVASNSPLGAILAAGIANRGQGRDVMKESISEAASHVVHDLEKYLNSLGTVAAIAPLLGLLGTVVGMIDVVTQITTVGTGNANALAGGISEALLTTAAGLIVAIPALVMHRYYTGLIDTIVFDLEREAIKLVDAIHNGAGQDYTA